MSCLNFFSPIEISVAVFEARLLCRKKSAKFKLAEVKKCDEFKCLSSVYSKDVVCLLQVGRESWPGPMICFLLLVGPSSIGIVSGAGTSLDALSNEVTEVKEVLNSVQESLMTSVRLIQGKT